MDLLHAREAAKESLRAAGDAPKKLAAIHIGAVSLLSLVLAVVGYFLSEGVSSTGGLSGIGTRTVLTTVQFLLSTASSIALPFWETGFLFAALSFARKEEATPDSLLEGFRRFAPLLRMFFLQFLIFLGLAVASVQISSILFTLTPLSAGAQELLMGLNTTDPTVLEQTLLSDEALLQQLLPHMIPFYIIFALLYAVVSIPMFYRFRMASFAMMDGCTRARAALRASTRLMRGNRWSLFLVDLRFWWFYAGQLLIALIAYVPDLLNLLGVSLPINPDITVLLFYFVYLVLQFFFFLLFGSYAHTTYAHCYEMLFSATPQVQTASAAPVPRDP